jgi:hypothetical protein
MTAKMGLCLQSLAVFLLTISLQFPSAHVHARSQCNQIFPVQAAPKSISYYLNQVQAAQQRLNNEPRFIDPAEESALVPLWEGTRQAPLAILNSLHDSTALINFQLLAADAGSVKLAQPGNFTSFRLRHTWEGKNMSTNIGLPVDAIVARTLSQQTTLVPDNAKAVMIFMHGGGTKTTGHHVAAALSNFMAQYGVVVLSMDAPFHAYGPRETQLTPTDYYRYLVSFRNEFIPSSVPTFIGGHSMGGLHADNLMRLSDNPEMGIREAFAGLVNLSGPMDNAPGQSRREKNLVEERITSDEELMSLVPEAERDLSVLLLTQGKSSALSGLSAETFMGIVNWQFPEHQGAEYPPTLAIMGERDALYVGREQIFNDYVTQLSNTEVHLMGQRSDFKGRESWISHMIFDHYRPGTDRPETFLLIKEFIESTLGEQFTSSGHPLLAGFDGSTVGLVTKLVQEYYINLAFRRFAYQYSIVEKVGTDMMRNLGEKTGRYSGNLKSYRNELRALKKEDPESPRIRELESQITQVEGQIEYLRSQQQSTYIPKEGHPDRSFAQANVDRRQFLNDSMQTIVADKKRLVTELKQAREQKNRLSSLVERQVQGELDQASSRSPFVNEAKHNFEVALDEMVNLQIRMNEANNQMVLERVENGDFTIAPTPEHIQIYLELDQAYARYNEMERAYRFAIEQAIAQGEFGQEAQDAILSLYGSAEAHTQQQPTRESLLAQVSRLTQQIESLEIEFSSLNSESNELLMQYIERITPNLYRVRLTTLAEEMNRPLADLIGHTSTIEKAWKIWMEIWKERPPEQGTSLY